MPFSEGTHECDRRIGTWDDCDHFHCGRAAPVVALRQTPHLRYNGSPMSHTQSSSDAATSRQRSAHRAAKAGKFQFALRELMIAVTVIAVFLGIVVTGTGDWLVVSLVLAVGCVWLTLLVTFLVWARGVLRVFAAGAAIPTACIFWFSEGRLLLGDWAVALLLATVGLGVLSGEAPVIIYKWLERNDWKWPGNWPWPPFPRD